METPVDSLHEYQGVSISEPLQSHLIMSMNHVPRHCSAHVMGYSFSALLVDVRMSLAKEKSEYEIGDALNEASESSLRHFIKTNPVSIQSD